jgi:hypothetical protein
MEKLFVERFAEKIRRFLFEGTVVRRHKFVPLPRVLEKFSQHLFAALEKNGRVGLPKSDDSAVYEARNLSRWQFIILPGHSP